MYGTMEWIWRVLLAFLVIDRASGYYDNYTLDPASRQLQDFKDEHPKPIGLMTTSSGEPVDIRDTVTLNTEIFSRNFHVEQTFHSDRERIPERLVHAKGVGAYGYFEVTNDVSQYTKADVFNGIGKKTAVVGRFSTGLQNLGGPELGRELKALALKMYTNEGNLDFPNLHVPVYFYKDPGLFASFIRCFRRNPRTNIFDFNSVWDFLNSKPETYHTMLWLMSDFGVPNGYRKMDIFPIHTYETYSKHGDRYFVKFNFRSEQGLDNLTDAQADAYGALDQDYFTRDLYNAIAEKNYPSWRLDIDVMTFDDIKRVDYDPFDVTRLWKEGTYKTVTIGRLVINRNVDNNFKDNEQSAYNPSNLVPGIWGPHDLMFKARRVFYSDSKNYRLGLNHNQIEVNMPKYAKTYNRDGYPPLKDNMKDAPNYYPNNFNGPIPYVDENRPKDILLLLESNAVDLQPMNDFYYNVLQNDAHRQRVADNFATRLESVLPSVLKTTLNFLSLVAPDLGKRIRTSLKGLRAAAAQESQTERYNSVAQCFERNLNPQR